MGKLTTSGSNPWKGQVSRDLTNKSTTITTTFSTAKTYVDRDIVFEEVLNIQSAGDFSVAGGAVSATASVESIEFNGVYDEANNGYPVVANAKATAERGAIKGVVGQAGWIDTQSALASVISADADSKEDTASSTRYIPKATFDVVGSTVFVSKAGYVEEGSAGAGVGSIEQTSITHSGAELTTTATATYSASNVAISNEASDYKIVFTATAQGAVSEGTYTNNAGYVAAHENEKYLDAQSKSDEKTITVSLQKAKIGEENGKIYVEQSGYISNDGDDTPLFELEKAEVIDGAKLNDMSKFFSTSSEANADLTITTGVDINKEGFIAEDDEIINEHYYSINKGQLSNTPGAGTYTENTEVPIKTDDSNGAGYLYINKGWYENTKISLDTLLPEIDGTKPAVVGSILAGYSAYDEKGNPIVGGMQVLETSDSPYFTASESDSAIAGSKIGPGFIEEALYVKAGSATMPSFELEENPVFNPVANAENKYEISYSLEKALAATVSEGWISSIDNGSFKVSGKTTIDKAEFSVDGDKIKVSKAGYVPVSGENESIGAVSAGAITASLSNVGLSTYFDVASTEAEANVQISANKAVTTAGYVSDDQNGVAETKMYKIKKGAFANASSKAVSISADGETAISASVVNGASDAMTYIDPVLTTEKDPAKSYVEISADTTMSATAAASCSSSIGTDGWMTSSDKLDIEFSGEQELTNGGKKYLEVYNGIFTTTP